jgi:hypothetical protein
MTCLIHTPFFIYKSVVIRTQNAAPYRLAEIANTVAYHHAISVLNKVIPNTIACIYTVISMVWFKQSKHHDPAMFTVGF